MRRNTLFAAGFVILFFVAVIVAPKPNDTGTPNGNAVGIGDRFASKVKSWIPVNATELPNVMPNKAKIHHIFLAGAGIAVNPLNELDFKYIRIITGRVLVPPKNISEESSTSPDLEVNCVNTTGNERCFTLVRAGVLFLDEDKYTLRNIDVDNDSATASIYQNGTEIGSIALVKVVKMNRTIWAGTLKLGEATYYAYILGLHHPLEVAGGLGEFKSCGPKLPSVNATDIARCKREGGRILTEKDEDGCPMAPKCVNATCPQLVPVSAQVRIKCRNQGGTIVGGVDDNGCPATPKCVLESGEVG